MPKNILLISYCKIGDSLIMLPALHALRNEFPDARIGLISEYYFSKDSIGAQTLLEHTGLIDQFFKIYTSRNHLIAPWLMRLSRALLCRKLRKDHWDYGIIMMPPYPPMTDGFADNLRQILLNCCVKEVVPYELIGLESIRKSSRIFKSADILVQNLSYLCHNLPEPDNGDCSLAPYAGFTDQASDFLKSCGVENTTCKVIAVAPSAHIPSNLWDIKNYIAVLKAIANEFSCKILVLGGGNDKKKINEIVSVVDKAIAVAGYDIRFVAELLSRCDLYLGNDTGLMHLAASKGVNCVAVFSCRNPITIWEPYGIGHSILRGTADCEGCVCARCSFGYPPCLEQISTEVVIEECFKHLCS